MSEQISDERLAELVNKQAAEIMADFFNHMPVKALVQVPEERAKTVGDFMFANGYRLVFGRWYLQADPVESALVGQLRALAEMWMERNSGDENICARQLDCLLSAHSQQAGDERTREVEVHLVASKDITKEDAEFICSVVDGLSDAISAHGSQQKNIPMPHNRCGACGTECGGMCGAV